jgi:hypothetical protein
MKSFTISPNVIRLLKPRRMRWVGMGEVRNAYKFWSEDLKGRDHWEI